MARDDYLSSGIGVLKTLLGTYILIIAAIAYAGSKDTSVANDPVAIEQEATSEFKIVSYNGKVFAVDSNAYDAFMQSDKEETVLIDALGQEAVPSIINKNDLEVLEICSSYDEAVQYIAGMDAPKGLGM